MLLVGAGIVVLLLVLAGTAGAQELPMTAESNSNKNPSEPGSRFAEAIACAEGFYVQGSRPNRNNNPGDLENWPGVPTDGEGYSVFSSLENGWDALEEQLNAIRNSSSRYYTLGMSFSDMGRIYAGGDPGGNWSSNVAAFFGASTTDPIGNYL